eukprot:TRINITY_DN4473_c0_g1_i1.p6 TRINITY_DN4473_c0_g1~~TRINITY_DN4473_c0_g1_i1.p6  ORF type:complete len:122 (-),score=5.13 TRINITY_DN4473_c0_g1_i1:362-727(-)
MLQAGYFLSDNSRNALVCLLMAFKLLEWWYETGEKQLGDSKLPIPPPPPPPRILHTSQQNIPNPNICRICKKNRNNPAQLTVSGFVFCYGCIYEYVRDNGKCPITQQRCSLDQVRRIYISQ